MDDRMQWIKLPKRLQAGDSFAWDPINLLPSYPSGSWTLTLYMFLAAVPGTPPVQVVAVPEMDGSFVLSMTPAQSAALAPGEYHWNIIVQSTDGTQRQTIDRGIIKVAINPAAPPPGYDPRSYAEKCLAAITAALEACAGDLVVEYEIDGVKAKKDRPAAEKLRAYWAGVVRRQRGGSFFTHVPVRFNAL
jgi:hypothetical protein